MNSSIDHSRMARLEKDPTVREMQEAWKKCEEWGEVISDNYKSLWLGIADLMRDQEFDSESSEPEDQEAKGSEPEDQEAKGSEPEDSETNDDLKKSEDNVEDNKGAKSSN